MMVEYPFEKKKKKASNSQRIHFIHLIPMFQLFFNFSYPIVAVGTASVPGLKK